MSSSTAAVIRLPISPYGRGTVSLRFDRSYKDAGEFLSVEDYANVQRWARQIDARPAVQRGRIVNKTNGDPSEQLRERHDASDFALRTQDKLEAA